jgi:hypothetical protein
MAFPIKFKGRDKETDVQVNKLVLFHPSPMRIDNVQHDAVLMLNDPFDQGTNVVILIPLRGSISAGQSGAFIGKVAPFISGILQPDATTKAYPSIGIPTGNDWDLTKVLPVTPNPSTNTVEVNSGYFVWGGIPAMEEYVVPGSNPWFTRYDWRTVGVAPTYIMLKNPIEINSFDLQTIRMLPVTPSAEAIHSPAMTTLTYKPGPAGSDVVGCAASSGTTRETFANGCDPLENIGQPSGTFRLDSGQVITTLSTLVGIIAGVIAVYFAMKMSVHPKYGLIFGALASKLGRAMSGATASAPPLSNARPPRPDARAPRSTSATPRPGSVLAGNPSGSTVGPSLSPEQVEIAVASEPDESKFDIPNPMFSATKRRAARDGVRATPLDVTRRKSLDAYRAPRTRASSVASELTPDQQQQALAAAPGPAGPSTQPTPAQIKSLQEVKPTISPNQVRLAIKQDPSAAGTGILPGSVVAPPIGQASTREETDQEKAAREREEVKNAERSEAKAKREAEAEAEAEAKGLEAAAKRKAAVQARKAEEAKAEEKKKEGDNKKAEAKKKADDKKAAEEAKKAEAKKNADDKKAAEEAKKAAEKKKEEDKKEEERLAARDAETRQRAEAYAALSSENKKKADAQQAKFEEQKQALDKVFAKLVRQKKAAEAKAEDSPTPANQQAVKEAKAEVKQNEQEQKSLSSKVRALFSRSSRPPAPPKVPSASSSGKTHLSARATAPERGTRTSWAQPTTAKVTKPQAALPPLPPRVNTAADELREARRKGQLLRMGSPRGYGRSKNTRKNNSRK